MFNQGKAEGYGRIVYSNSDFYQGIFKTGVFEGDGEFVYSNGTTLKGFWKGGKLLKNVLGN